MQKILINDIGFLHGNNRIPIILKIKYWQKKGIGVAILTTEEAEEFYEKELQDIDYIIIPLSSNPSSRYGLIFEYLKRNFLTLFIIPKVVSRYTTIYSISSVLDMLIFPYIIKSLKNKIRWCVVFDNTVVYKLNEGINTVNLLAYMFFNISLLLLRKADNIFAISEELKEFLINKKFPANVVVLTGNAVEADKINICKKIPKLKIDALYVGRINEAKGIYDLLGVVKIVKRKYKNFKLAIVGSGDNKSEDLFKNKILEEGLSKNVDLMGNKVGVAKFNIFKSSKIFLFLSQNESFGVAVLEAVCCGLVTVVYDILPFRKLYRNNEVVTAPVGDYNKVALEVLNIFKKGKFQNTSGTLLLKKYSWDSIAEIERGNF